jgi:SAM-dependent methyltransferase
MSEAPAITNYSTYNGRMELSMLDKLFFMDKISPDVVLDFGCANGVLLKAIHQLKPSVKLVGYDTDPAMARATTNFPIHSDWDSAVSATIGLKDADNCALILSSVIHEVCHYGSRADIDTFWNRVFNSGFEFIVIRDMVPSRAIDRVSNVNDVKKVYHKFLGTKALDDFERVWGTIENNKQLIHFLLKYRYLEPNWEREVRENYMPVTRESLLARIPKEYDIIFHEHYVLPYLLQSVRDDLGIEIKDPTHLKMILRRNV